MSIITDLHNLEIRKRRKVWRPFMEKYGCKRVCELGVRDGENFMLMIEHEPELAVGVDLWEDIGIPSMNDEFFSQKDLDQKCKGFRQAVGHLPFVEIHRDFTYKVAEDYPDEYFDFVYIDGDHTFDGVMKDIKAWYPKVKPGKFMFGHDFRERKRGGIEIGVVQAVMRFAHQNKLDFFVIYPMIWGIQK